jgi:hypothetical protein
MASHIDLPHLPAELLSQIFLEVDPHTLYTSIRCLSREWKRQVEQNLLKSEFTTNRWRVGLRVIRKPKNGKSWRGGVAGQQGELAPGAEWHRILEDLAATTIDASEEERQAEMRRARADYTHSVLSRQGAMEDELPGSSLEDASSALVHVLPLDYRGYDGESAMLQFGTANTDWYAMFERGFEEGENSSRLDLDFSIVWRFPGDGQDGSDLNGWGIPDQENGWLSRFYCSNFDTSTAATADQDNEVKELHTTPLARRVRRRTVTLQPEFHHPELSPSSSTLDWSDEGHEYMSLCLSLGTEFFIRRSAQANFLMRRLETEAEAGEDRRRQRRDGSFSNVSSIAPTPRRDASSSNSSGPRKSFADPVARLQGMKSSTENSSGASTPNQSSGNEKGIAITSYASVASTPASGCSSPRGMLLSMQKKGLPRIAKIQRELDIQPGNRAPFPSASTSGYSSVKHQARVQDKEDYPISNTSESLPSSPRQHLATSSSHGSIPRACFSAHLLVSPSTSPLRWKDSKAGSSSRTALSSSSSPLTLWEWSR